MALRIQLIFWTCAVAALNACGIEPTVTNTNSADGTVVSSCRVLNSSGELELAEGFVGPADGSSEPCITVAATAVILDCQGVAINLSGTAVGIRVDASVSDVTVKNCVVSGGEAGIVVDAAEEVLVEGNNITDGNRGIVLEGTSRSEVRGNTLAGQGSKGIVVIGGSDNTIAGNTVSQTGGAGISLENTNGNVVQGNESYGNKEDGIVVGHSNANTVVDNEVSTNGLRGLHVFNESADNTLRGNSSYCNTLMGVAIYTYSTNNTVEENTFYGNVYGIGLLHETFGNTIVNNESYDNEGCGLYLESATDNILEDNLSRNNGRCGLAVLLPPQGEGVDPSNNTFSNNRLLNNDSYGVVIASELVETNSLSDNETAGNGLEQIITPQGNVLSDFTEYVGAEPAQCSNP